MAGRGGSAVDGPLEPRWVVTGVRIGPRVLLVYCRDDLMGYLCGRLSEQGGGVCRLVACVEEVVIVESKDSAREPPQGCLDVALSLALHSEHRDVEVSRGPGVGREAVGCGG